MAVAVVSVTEPTTEKKQTKLGAFTLKAESALMADDYESAFAKRNKLGGGVKAEMKNEKTLAAMDDDKAKEDESVSELPILVKADVQGSAEAIVQAMEKIGNDEVRVRVLHSGVGAITETDVGLAEASGAPIMGFNVRANASARNTANQKSVEIRYYSVIYDLINDVRDAASGLLGTETAEKIVGVAMVRDVFRSSKFGAVAGCLVEEGSVRRGLPIRVLRDNVVIFEGELESLRRHKDDVNRVESGTECGIAVKNYNDVRENDRIECFERVEVKRTLEESAEA